MRVGSAIDMLIILIRQMREMKHRDVRWLDQALLLLNIAVEMSFPLPSQVF